MSRDDLWIETIASLHGRRTPPEHELALIRKNAKRSGTSIRGVKNRVLRAVELLKDAESLGLELVPKKKEA